MNFETDLERLIWHETGHLIIDILFSKNNDSNVNKFNISYKRNADSKHKWGGSILTKPSIPFSNIVEDLDSTSFIIINYSAGCLFETLFLNNFTTDYINFEDCFCGKGKCGGYMDYMGIFKLNKEFQNKYEYKFNYNEVIKIEIFSKLYETLLNNIIFMNDLKHYSKKIKKIVLAKFNDEINCQFFDYSFENKSLENIIFEVETILKKNRIDELILETKTKILNNIKNRK